MKRNQLSLKVRQLYWLIDKLSRMYRDCKLLIYKTIIKPVSTYGSQLWGIAAKSNIQIIQRFQNKVLRIITNAPWYIRNDRISSDLNNPLVIDEVRRYSFNYMQCLANHSNSLLRALVLSKALYEDLRDLKLTIYLLDSNKFNKFQIT